jgi:hypothetical protein
VRPELFLVARLTLAESEEEMAWLVGDSPPFVPLDPIDFLTGPDLERVYGLYRATYSRFDSKLNVEMPEALLDFNRWVLIVDADGDISAFACFKTTPTGLKLGLTTSDGRPEGRQAVVQMARKALKVDGVFGEVSPPIERELVGHVPEVPAELVGGILGKTVEIKSDRRHYSREITNVGSKTKLMVGRPLRAES